MATEYTKLRDAAVKKGVFKVGMSTAQLRAALGRKPRKTSTKRKTAKRKTTAKATSTETAPTKRKRRRKSSTTTTRRRSASSGCGLFDSDLFGFTL